MLYPFILLVTNINRVYYDSYEVQMGIWSKNWVVSGWNKTGVQCHIPLQIITLVSKKLKDLRSLGPELLLTLGRTIKELPHFLSAVHQAKHLSDPWHLPLGFLSHTCSSATWNFSSKMLYKHREAADRNILKVWEKLCSHTIISLQETLLKWKNKILLSFKWMHQQKLVL